MKTDTEIREIGFEVPASKLGPVEAEMFVTLLLRKPFDYTEWHKRLWEVENINSGSNVAMAARRVKAEQKGAC